MRDLYRAAALRWMIPLLASLSMSEMVARRADLAAFKSFFSIAVRISFNALRNRERNWRLCSRFCTLCRCDLSADAWLATSSATSKN